MIEIAVVVRPFLSAPSQRNKRYLSSRSFITNPLYRLLVDTRFQQSQAELHFMYLMAHFQPFLTIFHPAACPENSQMRRAYSQSIGEILLQDVMTEKHHGKHLQLLVSAALILSTSIVLVCTITKLLNRVSSRGDRDVGMPAQTKDRQKNIQWRCYNWADRNSRNKWHNRAILAFRKSAFSCHR